MPSLPDIKLPEIQRTYRPNHFSYSVDEKCQTLPRKKGMECIECNIKMIGNCNRYQIRLY